MSLHTQTPRIQITKLEAARRQLRVAISLWFQNGDEIAIHTLACAAHQIIHDINQKRGGRGLIFDSHILKDEYRKQAVKHLKRDMNFFKHADNDPEGVTDFAPMLSELFIMGSLWGIENFGLRLDPVEAAFGAWYVFKHPHFLSEEGLRRRAELEKTNSLRELESLSANQFFEYYMRASLKLNFVR
jgi:hypothetical protein